MQILQSVGRTDSKISVNRRGLAQWLPEVLRSIRGERRTGMKQMQLLETLPLGGKRQLMLVECAGEYFLVGGGLESVETIVRVQSGAMHNPATKNPDDICL